MAKIPSYPLFIALDQAAHRIAPLREAMAMLSDAAGSSRLLGVDLYYRSDTDSTLVCLRFDARQVTGQVLSRVRDVAALAGATTMDPALLSDEERAELYGAHLARYDIRVADLPGAPAAVEFLAQRLGHTSPLPDASMPTGEARFLRGDSWQPARPRSLTREGVFLATSTPPAFGSRVELQLSLGDFIFMTRADVLHVTPPSTGEALGWGGFGVRFVIENHEQREALDGLVEKAAGTALVTSALPPRRAEARYPIEWPALVWNDLRCAEVLVLDVSRHGVFINAGQLPHGDFELALAPAVEIGSEPIQMVMRIARKVSAQVAESRALASGFGLHIVSFGSGSEARFARFVERVARRIGQTVLVAAALERMSELCVGFAASGYTTLGAVDARTLLVKAAASARPPELIVIDASLGTRADVGQAVATLQAKGLRILYLAHEVLAAAQKRVDGILLGEATPGRQAQTG